jgi:putative membrane protein
MRSVFVGPALVLSGLLTLAAAWLGAFGWLLPGPFSAHMTMHMAVVAVAAPLCAFGVAGTRFDPVRYLPRAFAVVPASIAELILVWAWHTPALHQAARHSSLVFVCEQGSFLLSGLWLWASAVGGDRRERAGAGIIALLLTCMHMTLLGALLALPPRPLYDHGAAHAGRTAPREHSGHGAHAEPARIGALADQHLGGAIMIVLGGASYLWGGLWLAVGLLRQRRGVSSGPLSLAGLSSAAARRAEAVEPRP